MICCTGENPCLLFIPLQPRLDLRASPLAEMCCQNSERNSLALVSRPGEGPSECQSVAEIPWFSFFLTILPSSPVLRPTLAWRTALLWQQLLTFKTQRGERKPHTVLRKRGKWSLEPDNVWVTPELTELEKVISYPCYELISSGLITNLSMF